MPMQFLMDTDWAIEFLRGTSRFVGRIADLEQFGIAISIISAAELLDGVVGAIDPTQGEQELHTFLDHLQLLGVDLDIAQIFAAERYRLRVDGQPIGDFDLLIAATAIRHDLTLLTNNRRHFDRIPNLDLESLSDHPLS